MPEPGQCSRCGARTSGRVSLGDLCPLCLLRLGAPPRRPAWAVATGIDTRRAFGDFRLVCRIGKGPLGVVHEAQQVSTGRVVALKRWQAVASDATGGPPREIVWRAGGLKHPGIVPVHARGEREGTCFVATDRMEEGSLRVAIERRRGRGGRTHAAGFVAHVLRLFADLAGTLGFLHDQRVVHGGLKPENLLFAESGRRLLLTDLPPANGADVLRISCMDEPGDAVGYLAPEQRDPDGATIDGRADVYGLGACLREMLDGGPVATSVERLIERCLAAEPARRFASAAELREELLLL